MQEKQWWANLAALVGRVMIVISLIPNGFGKIFDFNTVAAGMGGVQTIVHGHPFPGDTLVTFPIPWFFLSWSILFDIIGSALILVGWFTRPVAAWMFIYCTMAVAIFHGKGVVDPGGAIVILRGLPMLGGFLLLAAFGAGNWSIDARRRASLARAPQQSPLSA